MASAANGPQGWKPGQIKILSPMQDLLRCHRHHMSSECGPTNVFGNKSRLLSGAPDPIRQRP